MTPKQKDEAIRAARLEARDQRIAYHNAVCAHPRNAHAVVLQKVGGSARTYNHLKKRDDLMTWWWARQPASNLALAKRIRLTGR